MTPLATPSGVEGVGLNGTDLILLQRLIASVLGQARYSTDGVVEQKLMASILAERLGFDGAERQRVLGAVA